MESLQNGLHTHSRVTLFVSIVFNKTKKTQHHHSVDSALTLRHGVNGTLKVHVDVDTNTDVTCEQGFILSTDEDQRKCSISPVTKSNTGTLCC